MALSSLWDKSEEKQTISIQHFKSRMTQIFESYHELFPEVNYQNTEFLVNEMYDIYRRTGHVYHSAYQISPAAKKSVTSCGIMLHRGVSPEEVHYMSGLGMYSIGRTESVESVADMFNLQTITFEDYLNELVRADTWTDVVWPDSSEFLLIKPPFTKGYWKKEPDKVESISLARYGDPNKTYAFYRYKDGRYQQQMIPEWRVKDVKTDDSFSEYRRIATAILKHYNVLPNIQAAKKGSLVEVHVGYRLPPTEEDFFKLYSWPTLYNLDEKTQHVYRRKMTLEFYPVFKKELEQIGYNFEED